MYRKNVLGQLYSILPYALCILETRRGFLTEKEKMYCNKGVLDSPLLPLLLLCIEPPPPTLFSESTRRVLPHSFVGTKQKQNLAKDYSRKSVWSYRNQREMCYKYV